MVATKVLLVDDHPVIRKGIRDLLEETTDIEVVGETSQGAEALVLAEQLSPDVMLLDMELPDMTGNDVVRRLKARSLPVMVLALSAYDDKGYIMESIANGAAGYLLKDEVPEYIVEAIRGVARGERGWISRQVAGRLSDWMQQNQDETRQLTPRESEVLRFVVDGKTNLEIAYALGISDKTVEKHLDGIFTKLGVASRVEAAVRALRDGLV